MGIMKGSLIRHFRTSLSKQQKYELSRSNRVTGTIMWKYHYPTYLLTMTFLTKHSYPLGETPILPAAFW